MLVLGGRFFEVEFGEWREFLGDSWNKVLLARFFLRWGLGDLEESLLESREPGDGSFLWAGNGRSPRRLFSEEVLPLILLLEVMNCWKSAEFLMFWFFLRSKHRGSRLSQSSSCRGSGFLLGVGLSSSYCMCLLLDLWESLDCFCDRKFSLGDFILATSIFFLIFICWSPPLTPISPQFSLPLLLLEEFACFSLLTIKFELFILSAPKEKLLTQFLE